MHIAQLLDIITLVTTKPPAARDVRGMWTGHNRQTWWGLWVVGWVVMAVSHQGFRFELKTRGEHFGTVRHSGERHTIIENRYPFENIWGCV